MCGLFGFVNYSNKEINGLSELTNSLAEHASVRGTDATGISFVTDGIVRIIKEAKPAVKINFKHSDNINSLIGHTRHSTQGSEKLNFNNHPFYGKTKHTRFALAHNGILYNDDELKEKFKLPKSKIETDSYIAVQLIESQKRVSFESIKYMAEKVEGSFSFSILDDRNNLYLVKGDSPVSIIHFPDLKLYVYASTDEILYKAIVDSPLFFTLKHGKHEEVRISEGDILKISSSGILSTDKFEFKYFSGRNWWEYGSSYGSFGKFYYSDNYIDDLKSVASYQGFSPDEIDVLLDDGYSPEEIEDYIYCFSDEF